MSESRIIGRSHDLTNYGDEDIPLGMKLGAYLLHSHEWRVAFLTRLTEVGYIGLIEASTRVYDQLNEPKAMRCALIAQFAEVTGTGKQAIYSALNSFLDDFLTLPVQSSVRPGERLEHWHARVMSEWQTEREREEALIMKFADALDGRQSATDIPAD